jgi:Domain of unknown function (DUF4386)
MDDSKWERWGALGGILFVVLVLLSAFLPGSPPKTSDSTADMAKFIVDKGDEIRIAGYLGAIALLPFFWFLSSLWRMLRRDEGGAPRLAVMAALGGAFSATVGALGGIVLALLPLVRSSLDPGLLRTLFILSTNIAFMALFGIATLALSASVVFIRSRGVPVWLGYLGILAGLVSWVGGGATVSTNDTLFTIGIVGFLLATLWILILSIVMLRHAPEAA